MEKELIQAVRNPGINIKEIREVLRKYGWSVKKYTVDEYIINDVEDEAYYIEVFDKNPNDITYLYIDGNLGNVRVSKSPTRL